MFDCGFCFHMLLILSYCTQKLYCKLKFICTKFTSSQHIRRSGRLQAAILNSRNSLGASEQEILQAN